MLDIIVLYFLCNHIRQIVEAKGYRSRPWIWRTIIFWLLAEMAGILIAFFMQKNMTVMFLSGLLCAIAAFIFVRNQAVNLPDNNKDADDWLDRLGRKDDF